MLVKNESGFTLIESVITAGIVVILIYAASRAVSLQMTDLTRMRSLDTRNTIISNLNNSLHQTGNIVRTAAVNINLQNCISGVGPCNATSPTGQLLEYDINTVDDNSTVIAGTTSAPILYSGDGDICTGPKCIYKARSWFSVDCAGLAICDPSLLTPVRRIRVGFEVKLVDSASTVASVSANSGFGFADFAIPLAGTGSFFANTVPLGTKVSALAASVMTQSVSTPSGNLTSGTGAVPADFTTFGNVQIYGSSPTPPNVALSSAGIARFMSSVNSGSDLQILNGNTVVNGDVHTKTVWAGFPLYWPTPTGYFQSNTMTIAGPFLSHDPVFANLIHYPSDRSLKKDFSVISNAVEKVEKLKAVRFNWLEGGRESIGYLAQDVEKIFPELVKNNLNGFKSVEYGNLIAPIVAAYNQDTIEQDEFAAENQRLLDELVIENEKVKRLRGFPCER